MDSGVMADEFLKSMGIDPGETIKPEEMTDEELAQLRFTTISDEEAKAVIEELNKRL
ncbi:hypothetical protein ACFP65_08265 [Marinilactibacillus sp. GCM10026970]|uniref:hypothetical protein n=1 Tax=Marinilactibacillus sp. GCM10026970 TaxID=3252642 RepID=UPI00361A4A1A